MGFFLGRKEELRLLGELKQKQTSSLVCVMARRRIGKSTLIAEFGKSFKKTIFIQGLGPDEGTTSQDQLDHFAEMTQRTA